MHAMICMF